MHGFAQFFDRVRLVDDLPDASFARTLDQPVVDRTADQHDGYIGTNRQQPGRDIEPGHAGHVEIRNHEINASGVGSKRIDRELPASIALRVSPQQGGTPVDVLADRGQLEQVVLNLSVNARDAMPAGGTLFIEVRTGSTMDSSYTAILEVRDTGVGMTPGVQARVFEPFFTTKELGRGTERGLATVYGIVRQHSGAIEIASVCGRGTAVTVRLPLAPAEREAIVEASARVESNQSGRVLGVEDEDHVRDVTARLLQRAGYDVATASDAETALGVLALSAPFDLVLTDSAMPGMRGEDLVIANERPASE